VEVTFDATSFFKTATPGQIQDLAYGRWGGCYAADEIAYCLSDENEDIGFMLRYVATVPGIGFECYVDEDEARQWLSANRPEAIPPENEQ
jgi:hypothetical protein